MPGAPVSILSYTSTIPILEDYLYPAFRNTQNTRLQVNFQTFRNVMKTAWFRNTFRNGCRKVTPLGGKQHAANPQPHLQSREQTLGAAGRGRGPRLDRPDFAHATGLQEDIYCLCLRQPTGLVTQEVLCGTLGEVPSADLLSWRSYLVVPFSCTRSPVSGQNAQTGLPNIIHQGPKHSHNGWLWPGGRDSRVPKSSPQYAASASGDSKYSHRV